MCVPPNSLFVNMMRAAKDLRFHGRSRLRKRPETQSSRIEKERRKTACVVRVLRGFSIYSGKPILSSAEGGNRTRTGGMPFRIYLVFSSYSLLGVYKGIFLSITFYYPTVSF